MIDEVVKILQEVTLATNNYIVGQLQGYDPNITAVQFYQGHLKEIANKLSQKDRSPQFRYQMFPAICLLEDYPEDVSPRTGIGVTGNYKVLIVNQTQSEYTSEERDTFNFQPVLWPIYNTLMNMLTKDKRIFLDRPYTHRRVKRKYWGRPEDYFTGKDSNILEYPIDAIELDLPLAFYEPYCNTLFKNF